jgi:hypothetical protein
MSEISVYDVVPTPKLADKLIGTSVGGVIEDVTYNFTLQELLQLFIPNLPANNLQGVLNYGNTATQNINLTGTITTTNLSVLATANILNSNLSGNTRVMAGLFDRTNASGTAGQFLRSTGTQVEWFTIPTVIPTLQQVLTSGNTADRDIILTANITAVTATASNIVSNTALSVNGVLRDGTAAAGGSNQILSSTGSGVRWVDMPVYNVISPLLYNTTTKTFSIQPANGSQNGYLSSADWINFDGKQDAIILTTAGTSGAATFVGNTLNIPVYSPDLSGYVPISRTLTINGTTYDLSANRSWTIDAGVAEVTATAPLSSSGGAYPDISISQSDSSTDGYLSSVDWLDFNSKQDGLNGTGLVKSTAGTITYITDNSSNWNTAYNDSIVSAAVTGTSTKTLTLNQQDGGTVTANWTDNGLTSVGVSMPSAFSVANSPLTSNGTIAITGAGTSLQYVDGTGALQTFPGLTGFVPYTGATTNVNLGVYSLTATSLIKLGGTSGQFLKADGSVDSSAYITLGSLSVASPLSYDNSIGAFSISQAGASANGYLSSTDWNTFNNKQVAGNYITSLTGEATGTGPGATAVTLNNASVTGKVLTGVNITGGTVLATDTMLTAFGKLQNQINGLVGSTIYQGVWDASTNTPTLTSSVGTNGFYYIVNVAGSTNLNGITDWKIGDWAIFNGGVWQKVDNTESVTSVNGFTGAVSLTTDNIAQGTTNLYFANSLARTAVSLTTTGSSGVATYNNTTGVFNIPNYGSALSGYLPLTGGTLTGGLYINPANTAVVGLEVASDTIRLRSDSTQPFARQLTTTMGSGTLVKMQAAGFGGTYVTDLGFYTSSSSAINTTPNLYLTGGNNRVGINTDVPAHTLDVVGTAGVSGVLTLGSTISNGTFTYTLPGATGTLALVGGAGVGTVTSVAALTLGTTGTDLSSTVANGTTTPVITLNVPTASATNRGALSSADWTTFNSKQATITLTTTSSSGASTFISNTLNVPNYTLEGLGGQPSATNLTSLSGLTFVSTAFVKMTAAGTFALDTTAYGTGSVTSVAALTLGTTGTDLSSTVATGTTTPVITLNVPTASATNRGALSAADWTTFNSKQNALTNPVTGTGTINNLPKFTAASTIGNSAITEDGTTIILGRATSTLAVATEANSITITQPSFSTNQPVKLLNFNWYDEPWSIGNIRSSSSPSNGLGIFATGVEKYRFTSGALVLAAGVNLQFGDNPSIRWSSNNLNLKNTDGSIPVIALRANGSNTQAPRLDIYNAADNAVNITLNGSGGTGVFNSSLQATDYRYSQDGYLTYNISAAATSTFTLRNNGTTVLGFNTLNDSFLVRNLGVGITPNSEWTTKGRAIQIGAQGSLSAIQYVESNNQVALGNNVFVKQNDAMYFIATNPAGLMRIVNSGSFQWMISPSGSAGAEITWARPMTLESTGNLLINTTTDAGFKLDVNGTGRFSGAVTGTGDAATTPSFIANNPSGASGTAQHYINFTAGATVLGRILRGNGASGLEANGLNIDNFAGFKVRLNQLGGSGGTFSVDGGAATFSSSVEIGQSATIRGFTGTTGAGMFLNYGSAGAGIGSIFTYNWTTSTYGPTVIDGSYVSIYNSGTPRMTVTGGNVGIATNSPLNRLQVDGTSGIRVSAASGADYRGIVFGATTADAAEYSYIKWQPNSGEFRLYANTAGFGGFMSFYSNNSEAMRITSGRNVLIGTTTDAGFKLNVNGSTNINGTLFVSSGSEISAIFKGATIFDGANRFYITNNASEYGRNNLVLTGRLDAGNDGYSFGTNSRNSLVFCSNDGGAQGATGTEYYGIQLQLVTKALYFQSKFGNDNGLQGFLFSSDNQFRIRNVTSYGDFALQVTGNSYMSGSITASSFFESSDATIKTLITDNYQAKGIESVIAKLYTKNGKEELGYYAQDVQGILPSAVGKGTDGLLSLSYREVHTAKIARLEKRVLELEQQLNLN